MNFKQLQKLMNGERVEVGDKSNQISCQNGMFLVEFHEFTSEKEGAIFSIGADFRDIEDAIELAKNHTSKNYTYS